MGPGDSAAPSGRGRFRRLGWLTAGGVISLLLWGGFAWLAHDEGPGVLLVVTALLAGLVGWGLWGEVFRRRTLALEVRTRGEIELDLRRSEATLRSIFRAAPIGIGMVADRVILEANDTLCAMTGYSRAELIGHNARLLYPTADEFEFVGREKYRQIAQSGTGTVETRWQRKDGRIIDVILSSTLLESAEAVRKTTFTALDITLRNQAERERLELERQLLHAQKLESLGILAGGIAHDFNNLLMAILGNLQLARQDLASGSAASPLIDNALKASRRAADLTQQLLAYSGKGRFLVQPINLSDLVAENIHILRAATPRSVTLDLRLAPDLPPILADPGQMQQVVMNLITNAAESYEERTGVVTLLTGWKAVEDPSFPASSAATPLPAGRYVFLEISDQGCGMDPATLERLFDPFFTTKFTGRGLGLSAVQGILRAHQGVIQVDSRPQQGSVFRVLIPAATPPEISAMAPALRPREAAPALPPSGGSILVIDDEEAVRDLCGAMLKKLKYRAILAADGEEGLRVFQARKEEILGVILDLTMPRLDGVATFAALTRLKPGVRVILSSGYGEQIATRRFAGRGPAGFIQKPYVLERLEEELTRVLQAGPPLSRGDGREIGEP